MTVILVEGNYYVLRFKEDGALIVGQRASADWFPEIGGVFWICGNEDPLGADLVEVISEISFGGAGG